jgi:large subunit ribosomal protein L32
MPVPKKRTSSSRTKMRRANHDRVEKPNLSKCSRCGAFKQPHRVCGSCGYYKDRQVIDVPDSEF